MNNIMTIPKHQITNIETYFVTLGSTCAPVKFLCRMVIVAVLMLFADVAAQTTFHGNNERTGAYPGAGPANFGGVKWTFKTGGPIASSAAIADGLVFIGSGDTFLYAIDLESGTLRWKFETAGPIRSSPAVSNGIVFFGSADGGFYAVDAKTGKLKWRFKMAYERRFEAKHLHGFRPAEQTIPDMWDFYTSSAVIDKGKVFFGSGDQFVYAVDEQTGGLQWKYRTADVVHASPAVFGGVLYIGSWDSYLYALDEQTGEVRWRFKTGEDHETYNQVGFQSSPVYSDGVIYVGCRDAHIYAINAASGTKKWDFSTKGSWVSATPTVRDGTVYVGTGDSGLFLSLDAATGQLQSSFTAKSMIFSSAAVAGNIAYFADLTGRLYAYDLENKKVLWDFTTQGSRDDPFKMLKPDGTLNSSFIRFFFDFEDVYFNMMRRLSVGSILSSPVVRDGTLYFGSTDGNLYALH